MTDVVTGSLQVDLKRRTTLPGDILAAAGIPAGSPLVARVEEPGRIVLESPALLLALLQDDIAAALAYPMDSHTDDDGNAADPEGQPGHPSNTDAGPTRDLVAELFADRAADTSLKTSHQQPAQAEPESLGHDSTHDHRLSSDDPAAPRAPEAPSSDLPHPRDGAA